jgi:methyl-accepting chemotaxis protein
VHHVDDVGQRVRLAAGTAEEINQHTHEAGRVSQEAVGLALEGRARMERLVEIVNRIAASSEQVRGISDTIGHLAAKTRMLSLNATIEAARAGEAGRGFAVVADEVGRLADSSAASSQEISELVRLAAEEAATAVGAVAEVRTTLEDIAGGAQRTDEMLGRVSQALELQRQALQGIEGSVSALEGISARNADTASEISGTMGDLTHLAAATNREVEHFTLN